MVSEPSALVEYISSWGRNRLMEEMETLNEDRRAEHPKDEIPKALQGN